MHVAGLVLGCLLAGQTPDAVPTLPMRPEERAPATLDSMIRTGNDSDTAPTSAKPLAARRRPPEMVAEAVRLPDGGALTGQPVTLLNALTSSSDRRQQLEITRAYWQLVQTVAEYRFCLDYVQNLERLNSADGATASLRLAKTSAAAMLRRAEIDATGAQCDLARWMRLPPAAALPLPADRPHVGPYRTGFQELFAGRTAPEQAVLMERILPIRRQAVDEQAAAVEAAEDVVAAVAEQRPADAASVAACSLELLRRQRAFIRTVCGYNRNIAEYGLAVAAPNANPQILVAILIGAPRQNTTPAAAGDVQPATATEPTGNPMRQPSAAPPRTGWRAGQPTLAPPRDEFMRRLSNEEPVAVPLRDKLRPLGKDQPPLAPSGESASESSKNLENKPLAPVESPAASLPSEQSRTAEKPVTGSEIADGAAASLLYPALAGATPKAQAKQLTAALHWDRSLPEGIGSPMSLADCLMRDPGTDRRGTIDAYWSLRQRAAEYQVFTQQAELLDALAPIVLEHRGEPSGAVDMLRLRSAQLTAQASIRQAHAALVEAQYALALRIGATGDAAWPLASTTPHSGGYLLMLEAQPPGVIQSWPVRRLASAIPALGENVQQHAAAVVEADAVRVAVAEQYRVGMGAVDQAIQGVLAQTQETLAVLGDLSDYNRSIAEYVLTVTPPTMPVSKLVAALVVKP